MDEKLPRVAPSELYRMLSTYEGGGHGDNHRVCPGCGHDAMRLAWQDDGKLTVKCYGSAAC